MYRLNKVNFNKVFKINEILNIYTMEITQLLENGNYLEYFKKHKVVYRKYPDLNLMIVKRKYGSTYNDDIPWLNYCRGLVIDTMNHKIVFCPPVKSKEVRTLDDFKELGGVSTELIDGTMVNIFYHNGWHMSTRSNIGCNNQWSADLTFKQMFDQCSNNLDYENLDKSVTYSFVMRHKKNRIITPVNKNQLYLIEVRQLGVQVGLPEEENGFVINKPIIRDEITHEYSLKKGFTITFEGIRYKWLTTECKFIELIKPNTNNPLLNYLTLRNSGHLTNYLKLYPEERFKFDKYRNQVHQLTGILHQFYLNVFVHKQIEKKDIPFALNPLMYDLHGIYLKEKQGISWSRVKNYIYELEPKRLCFALNNL